MRTLCIALALCAACTGSIGQEGTGDRRGGSLADPDRLDPLAAGGTGGDNAAGPGAAEAPAPSTRFARLTHRQWQHTVTTLLGLPAADNYAGGLRDDPVQAGFIFDNQADALVVDQALWGGYQRAAAQLAADAVSDPVRLSALAPPNPDLDARRDAFIDDFGRRAHRRPLSDAERGDYRAIFELAPALYPELSAFDAGVRMTIEATLQSPYFLYRTELGTGAEDGVVPLDGYEVASRLSYLLWDDMPDSALFAEAEAGNLASPEGARAAAARMLDDPRAEAMVVRFHSQLLDTGKYGSINPSGNFYDVSPELPAHALEETERFVRDIVFGQDAGLDTLLTSRDTFVNAELAAIYGLGVTLDDDTWQQVSLDPAERAGILTQVGFLAANATTVNPDPIHRGKFIAERISCLHINAPPADIPALPDPAGRTNRQVVEDHTEDPASICATCHATLINPYGFPFESFDAVGAFRTTDLNMPIDTAASPYIDGQPTPVADAVALATALAASEDVHACYAKHWLEFAQGRLEHDNDAAALERLATDSLGGAGVQALLLELVQTRTFLARAPEVSP